MLDEKYPLGHQDIPEVYISPEFDGAGCSEVISDIRKGVKEKVQNIRISIGIIRIQYPTIGNIFDRFNKKV